MPIPVPTYTNMGLNPRDKETNVTCTTDCSESDGKRLHTYLYHDESFILPVVSMYSTYIRTCSTRAVHFAPIRVGMYIHRLASHGVVLLRHKRLVMHRPLNQYNLPQ